MNLEEITAKCNEIKARYENMIAEKENAWAKYVNARDKCTDIAIEFICATDELDRAKELNNGKTV